MDGDSLYVVPLRWPTTAANGTEAEGLRPKGWSAFLRRRAVEDSASGTGSRRRIGRGDDQVDVERILWAALDAGLLVILERRNRRGDWEPYRWRLTENGEALVARKEEPIDVAGFLAETDDPNHPVLAAIRDLAGARRRESRGVPALSSRLGRSYRAGRVPRERLLSTRMTGYSKGIRIGDYREQLEEALGLPLEELVRKSGDSAIAAGPIRFRVNGIEIDARGIPPWLALPIETVEAIEWITIEADRLVTIENLTAFEEEVRRGLAIGTIALYVGGFAGRVERRLLDHLIAAGIRRIDHWSDLDLGGLRILRQLQSLVSVEVRAYRMEADLLERLPTQPLTDNDRVALRAWVADTAAPVRELAQALLTTGRKAEQEGWFLLHRRT